MHNCGIYTRLSASWQTVVCEFLMVVLKHMYVAVKCSAQNIVFKKVVHKTTFCVILKACKRWIFKQN